MKRNIKELLCLTAVISAATMSAAIANSLDVDTSNATINTSSSYDSVTVSSSKRLTVSGSQTELQVNGKTTNNGTISNSGSIITNTIENNTTINGDSGSLKITNGGSNSGTITQRVIETTGGTLNNTGTINANGQFTNSATITGGGTLNIKAGGSSSSAIEQGIVSITGGTFSNDASLKVTNGLTTSANVNNNSTIQAGSLTNSGTLANDTGKTITVTGSLNNNSTINNKGDLTVGSLTANNSIKGTGNLTVSGGSNSGTIEQGTFTNKSTSTAFSNTGTITADVDNTAGAKMTNSKTINGKVSNAGTFTNAGAVTDNVTNTSSFTNNGNIGTSTSSVGNVTNSGTFTNSGYIYASVLDNNSGSINNSNTISVGTLNNSAEIKGDNGSLTIGGGSSSKDITQKNITISGDFTNNAQMTSRGTFNNSATISGSGSLTLTNGTNTGTIAEAVEIVAGGTYNNGNTATAGTISGDITNGGTFNNNKGSITGAITNNNTFNNKASSTGDITNNGKLTNSGTINSATVTNNEGHTITNNNSMTVGSFINAQDAVLDGTGDLTVTTGSNSGSIVQNAITLETSFTNDGSMTANDTFKNTSTLTGSGDLFINAGGSSTGSITQDNITISGDFANENALTASGKLTNTGNITNTSNIIAAEIDNQANITGTGNVTAAGSNSGTINQTNVTLSGNLTNTGSITATNLNTGSSTLTHNATGNKKLTVTGTTSGTISGTGAMDIAGTNNADIDLGSVTVTGDLDNKNSIIADSIQNKVGVTLTNNGTLGDADSAITNNGTIANNDSIVANSITNAATGVINNNLSITAGTITNNGEFNNNSNGTVLADSITNNKDLTNNGTIGATDNRVSITNNGTKFENSGSIIASAITDTTGIKNTGSIDTNSVKISANGSIKGEGGSLTINNGGTNAGTIEQKDIALKGGTLNNSGSITSTNNFVNEATLQGTGDLIVKDGSNKSGSITQGNVTVTGAFTNEANLTANKTLKVDNNASISNTSEIVANAIDIAATGKIDGKGNITIGGGTNLGEISQTDVTVNGNLTNNGTLTSTGKFTNTAIISGEGSLNINEGSSTNKITQNNVTVSNDVEGNGFVNSAELNVSELLTNEGKIQNSSVITAVINNTAGSVIEGANGTINITSGTNEGSITQSVVNVAGALDNTGSIIASTFTNDALITDSANSGSITVDGNGTNRGSITQHELINNGTFTTTGENAQTNIETVDNSSSKFVVENGAKAELGTIDNTNGTIELTNNSTTSTSTLTITDLEKDLEGTIDVLQGENKLSVDGAGITSKINIGKNTQAILSIIDGEVKAEAVIKLTNNSTLNVDGADVTLDSGDSWTGKNKVTLDSGSLTLNEVKNNGLLIASGGELTLETGTLNISEGSSIASAVTTVLNDNTTLNINNHGKVTLNKGDTWDGKIVLGTANTPAEIQAPVADSDGNLPLPFDTTTIRDENVTLLDVSGLDSTGTLQANNGVLLLGDKNLDITGESYIAKEVAMQLSGNINVNDGGRVAIDDNDILTAAGNKNPQVTLSEGGTLDYGKTVDSGLDIIADAGNLNLLANSNLTFKEGSIEDAVVIDIQKDANLTLDASTLNLDNLDTWNGNIINKGGVINANGLEKSSSSATLTQNTGDLNLYNDSNLILGTESSITGGNITITKGDKGTNGSVLTVYGEDGKEVISGGNMTIDEYSKFVLGSGTFTLDTLSVSAIQNEDGTVQAGLVDVMNGEITQSTIKEVVFKNVEEGKINQANFNIDIYARSNKKTDNDTFIINSIDPDATVYINEWGLGGDLYGWDAPIDRNIKLKDIFFDSEGGEALKNNIVVTDQTTFTPIGWYQLNKNEEYGDILKDADGNPMIDPATGLVMREHIGSNYTLDLVKYNPQVFRGQIATVAQWMNQLNIDDMLFTHSMVLPSFKDPDGGTMANRYAAESPLFAPYQYSRKDGGLWYKMYGTFENLQMNNNLGRVGNNAYGALIGADFGLKELKNGWKFMPTAYVGYNGAHQTFAHMGQYQNGGQAGFMGTWYKDNLILGALAYGGIYDNSMDVRGFNDSTFNYFAGAATKAAYNIRLHRDWVLQPNLFVSYNYFGQQNWHSKFGQMGMMAGDLNGVNIAPGLNLIWERDTFSAYGTLQYMYNINGACGGHAGNVGLPQVEMERGYIQYGLGINKKFTDRASGYLQAVLRNVGRTGVGFQAGFNYMLGK